jgi:hypothetical protein
VEGVPRFVKAGSSNVILASAPAFINSVVLTSKTGAASLSVYASASSTVSAVTQNRLLVSVNPASGPRTASLDLGGSLWPTGITVSCNGAGALAILNITFRSRPH